MLLNLISLNTQALVFSLLKYACQAASQWILSTGFLKYSFHNIKCQIINRIDEKNAIAKMRFGYTSAAQNVSASEQTNVFNECVRFL